MEQSKALQLANQAGFGEIEAIYFEAQAHKYKQTLEDKVWHTEQTKLIVTELNRQLVPIIQFVNMILAELWSSLGYSKCCGRLVNGKHVTKQYGDMRCTLCFEWLNDDGTKRNYYYS